MKKNFNFWSISLFTLLFIILCAGGVRAQPSNGQASVLMGDYTMPGFGEVSTPELGNQFHRISGEAFFSLNEKESFFLGGIAQSYSRQNTSVNSVSSLVKGRIQGNHRLIELAVGPTFQYRDRGAIGGTLIARAEFRSCDDNLSMFVGVHAEVGGRSIFYDQHFGARFKSVEGRIGFSSLTQGQYVQLSYFTCERYSIGVTYAWDKSMNDTLESQGLGDQRRQALGFQATVHF